MGSLRELGLERTARTDPRCIVATTRSAFAESSERYASLFTYHPHETYSVDRSAYYTDANPLALAMAGLSLQQTRETHFAQVVHPEDAHIIQDGFDSAVAGNPNLAEARVLRTDGQVVHVRCTMIRVVIGGEIVGVHGVTEDVTAAKQGLAEVRVGPDCLPTRRPRAGAGRSRREAPTDGEERWLFSLNGYVYNRNSAGNQWRSLRAKVGMEAFTLHDLRHYFALGLIADGCDVVTVQHALGHSSASITLNVYSHLAEGGGPDPRCSGEPHGEVGCSCGLCADSGGFLSATQR